MRRKYQLESHIEALKKFYQEHERRSLFAAFRWVNTTVSGLNRVYENPFRFYEALAKSDGVDLILFSGPVEVAWKEADKIEETTGHKVVCITVDRFNQEELRSLKEGGRALLVANELIPNQRPDDILVDEPIRTNIKYRHVTAVLPYENGKVLENLPHLRRLAITDKRGSLLYLKGEEQLTHLENLFSLAEPGTVIYLSKGISRWLYVDLILQKKDDNSLEIVDCIPGLKSSKFHSYIEDNAYTTPFLAGDHWVRNVLQMRQFLYNVIGVELETMTKDLKYEAEVTDAISKAMAAEAYSPAVAQGPTPEYLITPAFIASKFFATLTTQGLEKAKEFLEEIKQVVHKYDEKNILLIRLLEHFDREKFHQLVARVAGASRVTTARQGIFFPDQALEGLAPVLGGGDRPSPTATG